jgi:hypothetical protein
MIMVILFYCFLHKSLNLLLSNYSQMTGFWFRYLRSTLYLPDGKLCDEAFCSPG